MARSAAIARSVPRKARAVVAFPKPHRGGAVKLGSKHSTPAASTRKPVRPSYERMIHLEPLEHVAMAKQGLPANAVPEFAERMGVSSEWLFSRLGLASATIGRKLRSDTPLSTEEGARTLGLARLIGLAQRIVEESGTPASFNAAAWVAHWLEQPLPALGGEPPAHFMDTSEGQAIVAGLLAQIQHGTYA